MGMFFNRGPRQMLTGPKIFVVALPGEVVRPKRVACPSSAAPLAYESVVTAKLDALFKGCTEGTQLTMTLPTNLSNPRLDGREKCIGDVVTITKTKGEDGVNRYLITPTDRNPHQEGIGSRVFSWSTQATNIIISLVEAYPERVTWTHSMSAVNNALDDLFKGNPSNTQLKLVLPKSHRIKSLNGKKVNISELVFTRVGNRDNEYRISDGYMGSEVIPRGPSSEMGFGFGFGSYYKPAVLLKLIDLMRKNPRWVTCSIIFNDHHSRDNQAKMVSGVDPVNISYS